MDFTAALVADGPVPGSAAKLALFGTLVGTWRIANALYSEVTGEWNRAELTWTFAWIIGGRGIQDVLVDASGAALGTTVRTWDERSGWHVVWFCPRAAEHVVLTAEAEGTGIRLDGRQADGRPVRWRFSDMSRGSFTWDGWCSNDDGATWWHEQHMDAERVLA
jgi:hypothetical protein